jgi:hypothetical protein
MHVVHTGVVVELALAGVFGIISLDLLRVIVMERPCTVIQVLVRLVLLQPVLVTLLELIQVVHTQKLHVRNITAMVLVVTGIEAVGWLDTLLISMQTLGDPFRGLPLRVSVEAVTPLVLQQSLIPITNLPSGVMELLQPQEMFLMLHLILLELHISNLVIKLLLHQQTY